MLHLDENEAAKLTKCLNCQLVFDVPKILPCGK